MRREYAGRRVRLPLRSSRSVGVATAFSVVVSLGGCTAMQETFGGWFGAATPTPTPESRELGAATAPSVYYAGIGGLKVQSQPSASSKVIGQLSLHEKVTRTRLERGYAYVESPSSGMKGWVDNARLIWQLPAAPTSAAPAPAEPRAEEPIAPTSEGLQPPAAPEATATATEPQPTTTPAPARSKETPGGVAPSIFNPY